MASAFDFTDMGYDVYNDYLSSVNKMRQEVFFKKNCQRSYALRSQCLKYLPSKLVNPNIDNLSAAPFAIPNLTRREALHHQCTSLQSSSTQLENIKSEVNDVAQTSDNVQSGQHIPAAGWPCQFNSRPTCFEQNAAGLRGQPLYPQPLRFENHPHQPKVLISDLRYRPYFPQPNFFQRNVPPESLAVGSNIQPQASYAGKMIQPRANVAEQPIFFKPTSFQRENVQPMMNIAMSSDQATFFQEDHSISSPSTCSEEYETTSSRSKSPQEECVVKSEKSLEDPLFFPQVRTSQESTLQGDVHVSEKPNYEKEEIRESKDFANLVTLGLVNKEMTEGVNEMFYNIGNCKVDCQNWAVLYIHIVVETHFHVIETGSEETLAWLFESLFCVHEKTNENLTHATNILLSSIFTFYDYLLDLRFRFAIQQERVEKLSKMMDRLEELVTLYEVEDNILSSQRVLIRYSLSILKAMSCFVFAPGRRGLEKAKEALRKLTICTLTTPHIKEIPDFIMGLRYYQVGLLARPLLSSSCSVLCVKESVFNFEVAIDYLTKGTATTEVTRAHCLIEALYEVIALVVKHGVCYHLVTKYYHFLQQCQGNFVLNEMALLWLALILDDVRWNTYVNYFNDDTDHYVFLTQHKLHPEWAFTVVRYAIAIYPLLLKRHPTKAANIIYGVTKCFGTVTRRTKRLSLMTCLIGGLHYHFQCANDVARIGNDILYMVNKRKFRTTVENQTYLAFIKAFMAESYKFFSETGKRNEFIKLALKMEILEGPIGQFLTSSLADTSRPGVCEHLTVHQNLNFVQLSKLHMAIFWDDRSLFMMNFTPMMRIWDERFCAFAGEQLHHERLAKLYNSI